MTVHRPRVAAAATATAALMLLAACGGGSSFSDKPAAQKSKKGPVSLQLMIGSSGDAETNAVNAAAKAWGAKTGNTVKVIPAKDLNQQLTQSLAGGAPPDVFYVNADRFAGLAEGGSLAPVGDKIANKDDFYPALVKTFTNKGKFYCAPKDFSTLALEINTDMWAAAGLKDSDVPTTWAQLQSVAKKLTTKDHVGLAIGDTRDRVGAFFRQAGGWIVNEDGSQMTANAAPNVEALDYVAGLLNSGVAKYPKQLDASWAGEAFGKKKAAMTMEGNWFLGAMKNDFPDVKYTVAELPAGPKGKGTLTFTQCWGVAAKSANQAAAIDFINFLTTPEQQLAFADAFGVMPSRQAAKPQFETKFPDSKAYVAGGDYAQGPVTVAGFDTVLLDFDSKLFGLSDGSTKPKSILESLQKNGTDALKG